ncbi:hypothetical protein [Streptomyces lydicus]|uniref:hypothetical protein n=1 Tax=Streptomyces lydicus TaxID=47763 RepID=UPI0036E3E0E4
MSPTRLRSPVGSRRLDRRLQHREQVSGRFWLRRGLDLPTCDLGVDQLLQCLAVLIAKFGCLFFPLFKPVS